MRDGTVLLADASGSMAREGGCLELAASVAWRLGQALAGDARLEVYQFGTDARPVTIRRRSGLDRWRSLWRAKGVDVRVYASAWAVWVLWGIATHLCRPVRLAG